MPARTSITLRALLTLGVLVLGGHSSFAAAQARWPSLLVALEHGYQPGLEELPRVAAALADAPEEVLVAWDRQGHFLLHQVGSRHTVEVERSQLSQLEGSVVVHNHPRGLPASPRDFDTVLRHGLRRLYVVARVDGVVSLTDISRDDALRRAHQGGSPPSRPAWRPVVEAAPAVAIEGPAVLAAQVAYSLLGAWM